MFYKIIKKDFERKKGITIVLFLFILLSSILIASGTYMITVMMGSIDNMFEASKIPDYVQMHSGNLDEKEIERFSLSNPLVEDWQVVKMISVDPGNLYLGNNPTAEINSVMDISFVEQNQTFDFLLNMENKPVSVKKGQIGVPVYYLQKYNLKKGDRVRLKLDEGIAEFIISDFVRDAQMNPTVVSSKRFVISQEDYSILTNFSENFEYSIKFLLKEAGKLSQFSNEYQAAGLPAKGPTLDAGTFKLLNALTDGIVAAVIILISLLLVAISVLCLRFTFLASIEEDYGEIGVMKAIGIRQQDIKAIYLMKYVIMGAAASLAGYLLSFWVGRLFTSNMVLYLGTPLTGPAVYLMPFITTGIMYLFLILSCMAVLKQLNKISAFEALRSGRMGDIGKQLRIFHLDKRTYMSPDVFMGLNDIICRFPVHTMLLFIFTLSAFIMIIPVNLYNTIGSDEFITYMGIGRSEIRMDLQQSEGMEERYASMIESIKKDPQVSLYSPTFTCKYKVKNEEGLWENLNVETGDFNIFPLEYMTGKTPSRENEIALSYLVSDNLKKDVGDQITLIVDGVETPLTVSGIYQGATRS
ncbi:MAG: ABC transporter permease [Hungatella sp.]|jgi:putative ABC transport system permease protein|nr:ABC transporter permease [Hungatella sp.]